MESAVILVADAEGPDKGLESYVLRLQDEGFKVEVAGDWYREQELLLPDAKGLKAIREAKKQLGYKTVFVLGFGSGGLFARLAACTIPGLSGAVDIGGRLSYPQVTPQKPAQPLDLLLGLGCPLQCHHPLKDPAVSAADLAELTAKAAHTSQLFQSFTYSAQARFYHPLHENYEPDAAEAAWWRAMRFLGHLI
jgi:dienelactone hydrolase